MKTSRNNASSTARSASGSRSQNGAASKAANKTASKSTAKTAAATKTASRPAAKTATKTTARTNASGKTESKLSGAASRTAKASVPAKKAASTPAKKAAAVPAKKAAAVPAKKAAGASAGRAAAGKETAARSNARGGTQSASGGNSFSNDLNKLLKDGLKDIYWAEKQITKGLKKMSKAVMHQELVTAFNNHQQETEAQIQRLEQVFSILGQKAQGKRCPAIEGILEEGNEQVSEYEKGPGRDAALIVAAQKVEHYEIAAYGSLRTFAQVLGQNECVRLLEEILEEERKTDELLTQMAMTINQEAMQSHLEEG